MSVTKPERCIRVELVRALALVLLILPTSAAAQHSTARLWNEALLEAIRNDFARPTVHARNLFHTSAAMYDAWAAYDEIATPYLLGQRVGAYSCPLSALPLPSDVLAAREEAISYAAYRLLNHRFRSSPGAAASLARFDSLLTALGYDAAFTSTDYSSGSAAALGNSIALCLIDFGLEDGSNESGGYEYLHYEPVNPPLTAALPGNPDIVDPNRWQPLTFPIFIDQSGNVIPGATPKFLGPEWGVVTPFSLSRDDLTVYTRDGGEYWVYHDPGPPPHIDAINGGGLSAEYQWHFALVAAWSSHLDPSDGVEWDISPATMGNVQEYPRTLADYPSFFNFEDGGDTGRGHAINPHTGRPYEPQIVPRGDYTRVLAEFWADGPQSETPPGHWFTILNYVGDHLSGKRLGGDGPILDDLEWDVKAYLTLGGAVHDVAVTVWGMKGWYDFIRPISAIRAMADRGQSTDPALPRYSIGGIPLMDGFIELVQPDDPLASDDGRNVNKIKLQAWIGPDAINDPDTQTAGVGWILAENWWPYQRPTFVTPPFAGYVSGHSTFSRAAAEVLTLLTGDPYFPGGMGEFRATKNEFLVFEEGPSVDVVLQWATYRDASDQTSLSRIWGGIHPPIDDIPGRLIGEKIGVQAFSKAEKYFSGEATAVEKPYGHSETIVAAIYPNPVRSGDELTLRLNRPAQDGAGWSASGNVCLEMYNVLGQALMNRCQSTDEILQLSTSGVASGAYLLVVRSDGRVSTKNVLILR